MSIQDTDIDKKASMLFTMITFFSTTRNTTRIFMLAKSNSLTKSQDFANHQTIGLHHHSAEAILRKFTNNLSATCLKHTISGKSLTLGNAKQKRIYKISFTQVMLLVWSMLNLMEFCALTKLQWKSPGNLLFWDNTKEKINQSWYPLIAYLKLKIILIHINQRSHSKEQPCNGSSKNLKYQAN